MKRPNRDGSGAHTPIHGEDLQMRRVDSPGSGSEQPIMSQVASSFARSLMFCQKRFPYPGTSKWTLVVEARMRGTGNMVQAMTSHGAMGTVGLSELWTE